MKRFIGSLVAAIALVIACSGSSTGPQSMPSWVSAAWQYSYTRPGYAEGLTSIAGHIVLSRSGDSARVSSDGNVVGSFWSLTAGTPDTVRGQSIIWPAGIVVRGTVTLGDSFTFVTADNPNAWPTLGQYRIRGDSLLFLWTAADSTSALSLAVRYVRQ